MKQRNSFHPYRQRAAVAVSAVTAVAAIAGCGSSGDDGVTGTDNSRPVDTAAVPAQVTWRPYQGVQVPYSDVDGPTDNTTSAAPTGYSHTPQGAVLAAIQGQTRLALAPDSSWAQATGALVAAGAGRDSYAVARAGASITAPADPATTAAFTGFRVTDYRDEQADIDLATTMPGGQLTTAAVTVLWRGDDWKIALPAPDTGGDGIGSDTDTAWDAPADTDPVPLTSLDGFTAFAADTD
ncbi:hypothetical protein DK926_19330 [Rhodococcus sp. Eu-32]|uniref:hypothetical protein n=1 Tax=Rhodococcus sp. Eu-32 TaxID=1017319 RepID=UPI000DF3E0A7|nr:hypothetical protein [Rhodococcus sp. Eu-32]RRQ26153.1 hypothetical protein DK926_19330 [Rhodococcus sp. Eu-32]